MQGQKSSITTLSENLSFERGSTSSEPVIDSQISWNNMQTPPSNHQLPEYRLSPNGTNLQYLNPLARELPLNAEWSLGETSRGDENNERKRENAWSLPSRPVLSLDGPCFQAPNILPQNININLNANDTQPQDLNMQAEFEDSEHLPSGRIGHIMNSAENVAGCSVVSRHMSCKRKSPEVHAGGQSSGAGGSRTAENGPTANNGLEQANSRLRLGPEQFSPSSAIYESSQRNCRLRINGLRRHQDHHVPLNPTLLGPANPPDDPSSRARPSVSLRDRLLALNPPPISGNGRVHDQSGLLHAHSSRRNTQLSWTVPGATRVGNFSASGEREAVLYEEPIIQNELGSISEHPIFVPASEVGSLPQQPVNWNFASVAGPRLGSANSSGSSWANRSRPQYSRRLSDIARRSLLTSAGVESSGGGQSSSEAIQSGPSQGVVISSGPGNQSRHLSGFRSGLSERQLADGAYGLPHSLRNLAAAGEGRANLMSEHIRHVLDLMRRGEGLRLEDVMILDRSLFFGMANRHDRHRDMRLDIDNMSYEELLALGERIGHVSTGLNEGTIMSRLKQTKYVKRAEEDQAETEPCSICREEYINGENLGILDCGHEFHRDCIKQWLGHKNLCPICKMTGLAK
ncbi:RING/U-box superfamily protein [Striga hermonthica]|uniref:RING-type E3 ubiquitin transferase n=1 Tax=Striga hermonthica TaxID=68872 RepID=A0A9N7N0J4_STRHE|nr:RING/U-box superfamily protein [Striga hermonthica]